MKRPILAFIAGLLAWVVMASVLNRLLRLALPGYMAAEPTFVFTLGMLWARLALGAVSSLTAGFVVARVAPTTVRLPLALGLLLLMLFIPLHYELWGKFPIWYHLAFLGYLVPFVMLGAHLSTHRKALPSQS
jgi:hypothetical protein